MVNAQVVLRVTKEEYTMKKVDINDIPVLDYDAGLPDTRWGETTTGSVTVIVSSIIIFITG